MTSKFTLFLSAALIFFAVITTAYWSNLSKAFWGDDLSYQQRRIRYAFNNLQVDQIAAKLNVLLPLSTPIALSPQLLGNDFTVQRLTEALYPRIIDKSSPHVLELTDQSFLSGPSVPPPSETAITESFDFSWIGFFLSLFSALGFGFAAYLVFFKNLQIDPECFGGTAITLSAVVLGLFVTLATWFQIPLSWHALDLFGLFLLVPSLVYAHYKTNIFSSQKEILKKAFHQPETVIFAALLFLFFIRVAEFPISLWDGRSIWLFHTKSIFMHGMFTKADLTHADSEWTNAVYPMLFPAWLAHFSGWSSLYNERMASLGIPVFFSALLSLVWCISRSCIGRWPGSAFTAATFFAIEHMAGGAYVDQYLMVLLCLQILSFSKERYESLGWITVLTASLLKVDGFIFSAIVLFFFTALHPRFRKKIFLKRFFPFIFLFPALLHRVWTKWIHVSNVIQKIEWKNVFLDLPHRISIVLEEFPKMMGIEGNGLDYTQSHSILWEAFLGFAISLILFIKFKKNLPQENLWLARMSFLVSFTFTAIAFGVICSLQFDTKWLVYVTLDRLLLNAAMPMVFLPFLLSSDMR